MDKFLPHIVLTAALLVAAGCHAFDLSADCSNSENPIACRSANFLAKALNQVVASTNNEETLRLLPGLEIIQNENVNHIFHGDNDERSMAEQNNETFFMRMAKYLQTHDLKIKFSDMVGKTDLQEIVNNVFNSDDPAIVGELEMLKLRIKSWKCTHNEQSYKSLPINCFHEFKNTFSIKKSS
jgi:hypothetical protein